MLVGNNNLIKSSKNEEDVFYLELILNQSKITCCKIGQRKYVVILKRDVLEVAKKCMSWGNRFAKSFNTFR